MPSNVDSNERPDYDPEIQAIADYVLNYRIDSQEAWDTARHCLMDTLGCGLLALRFPAAHPARWRLAGPAACRQCLPGGALHPPSAVG